VNPNFKSLVDAIDHLTAAQQKGPWDYAGTVAVVLTLGFLVWYTVETFWLRKAAQQQNEHSTMPIVSFQSSYTVTGQPINVSLLAIRNMGSGPAFNVEIKPLAIGDKSAFFKHARTLAPGELNAVEVAGLMDPATQDSFGQVSRATMERTSDLMGYLERIQRAGQIHGEITYMSATGKRYRTRFTLDHTLDYDSFIAFDGMGPV
jgi:hypothetical protein